MRALWSLRGQKKVTGEGGMLPHMQRQQAGSAKVKIDLRQGSYRVRGPSPSLPVFGPGSRELRQVPAPSLEAPGPHMAQVGLLS